MIRCFALVFVLLISGCGSEPAGGPLQMRKLSEAQYHQIIADIFGENIQIVGRFESEKRTDGLLAIGSSSASVTEAGIEQFYSMAGNIAEQALNEENRAATAGCEPVSINATDESCAKQVFSRVGRLLFRRALTDEELDRWYAQSVESTATSKDFFRGLEVPLTGMLVSPEFLFRIENAETDPEDSDRIRLDGYSKAARLSFLLWNTSPDHELLTAAEQGDLHTGEGLQHQAERLLESPRLEDGMRAFFRDFLGMEHFESLQKDKLVYPVFDQNVTLAAEEQILKLLIDHLLTSDLDYRDLFTTRDTFMNRPLGMVYAVPVRSRDAWERYTFPDDDPRVGLLSHVGFTALHSHRGRSSPTLRGIAIRERLMCQPVKPPPAAVNFTVVQDTSHPLYKTARERLTAHRTEPVCAGCHKVYDPIGLALENYDGAGIYRVKENGVVIDTSGVMDGVDFQDAAGLGQAMHDNPAIPSCVVNSIYNYAVGREATASEQEWLIGEEKVFAKQGFRLRELLRRIASSATFYTIRTGEQSVNPAAQDADNLYEQESTI